MKQDMFEIGGEFSLPTKYLCSTKINQIDQYVNYSSKLFLSSGRGCLRLLAKAMRTGQDNEVLLPSYLCEEIIKPFTEELFEVKFYRVNEELDVDLNDLRQKINKKTRTVLFINYFGFPQPMAHEIKALCGDTTFLIEDLVQSFLTQSNGKPIGFIGDATISSYRKWIPIPDGALLGINNSQLHLSLTEVLPYQKHYVETRLRGLELKGDYLNRAASKKSFREMFASAESMLDSTPFKMSNSSKTMLVKYDFKSIIDQRRENFLFLLSRFWSSKQVKPLYQKLPSGICPLGFPVITKKRSHLKKLLIANRIYPPIHWSLVEAIDKKEFPDSWSISKHILTIPIDQRYNKEDMQFIADVLNKFEAVP